VHQYGVASNQQGDTYQQPWASLYIAHTANGLQGQQADGAGVSGNAQRPHRGLPAHNHLHRAHAGALLSRVQGLGFMQLPAVLPVAWGIAYQTGCAAGRNLYAQTASTQSWYDHCWRTGEQKGMAEVELGLNKNTPLIGCLDVQTEVAAALRGFEREGAEEVELDLRGNLGGLVSQGVETARLFLEGKLSTQSQHGDACGSSPLSLSVP
jgi:Peptidase family S41